VKLKPAQEAESICILLATGAARVHNGALLCAHSTLSRSIWTHVPINESFHLNRTPKDTIPAQVIHAPAGGVISQLWITEDVFLALGIPEDTVCKSQITE
jgi:hypothetical protein